MLAVLPLLFAAALPAPGLEVYFEVKFLVRDRVWGRRVEIDQWSGGRLRLEAPPGKEDYRIVEVLEDPWTFRWYPALDEVKLGAAIHLEHAAGKPYDTLAAGLEPLAREKYASWWDADEASPGPPWSAETGRFWADRHARERAAKDALPNHPTYPFHVLGPLAGRFELTLRDGAVERVEERMTRPWLEDGWARSLGGEAVEGYGYWDRKRPGWEPKTYEAFVAALELLGPEVDLEAGARRLVERMQPLARGGPPREGRRVRSWRDGSTGMSELQLLIDSPDDGTFKLWVRVGYRATPPRTP